MKKLFKYTLMSLLATTALYAKPITWGTGGPTGNYFKMSQEIVDPEVCGNIGQYELLNTGGSSDNIYGATIKKYKVFWTSADVLFDAARGNPKVNQNNFKIIARMHDEPVHLLVPKGYKPSKGMFDSLASKWDNLTGAAPVEFDVSMLKDQTIGSWGGSLKAAQALSNVFQLNATIKAIPEAYRTNPGIPTLLVGGAPYAPVEKILATGKYMLVALNHTQISSVAPHYVKSGVTYKIDGKITNIPTVAVPALLMGKASRKASRNLWAKQLATCIDSNLDFLSEESSNVNWESAFNARENGNALNWQYFDLIENPFIKTE